MWSKALKIIKNIQELRLLSRTSSCNINATFTYIDHKLGRINNHTSEAFCLKEH